MVAHSHLDPGWLLTIDEYYKSQVRQILINVIDELSGKESDSFNQRKFTWCETIFLRMFWEDKYVKSQQKSKLESLLRKGLIEIAGGGWI